MLCLFLDGRRIRERKKKKRICQFFFFFFSGPGPALLAMLGVADVRCNYRLI
jgi:hypothetical protein